MASTTAIGAMPATNDPLNIGGNGIRGEFLQGRFDELRLKDRAPKAFEIQADMNAPSGRDGGFRLELLGPKTVAPGAAPAGLPQDCRRCQTD